MKYFLPLFLLMTLVRPSPAGAQTVRLPAEIVVPKGNPLALIVPTESDADDLSWVALDSSISLFPPELLARRDVGVVLTGNAEPGRYRVACVAAKVVEGKARLSPFAVCVVVIGGGGPPVPPPLPPVPPVPPPRPPVPPMPPADPLAGLQAIYDGETDPQKAETKDKLVTLYRTAVGLANNPAIATWGNLLDAVGTEATVQGVRGKLTATQAALGAYFRAKLPAAQARNTPLDAGGRATAALAFESAASALEGLR